MIFVCLKECVFILGQPYLITIKKWVPDSWRLYVFCMDVHNISTCLREVRNKLIKYGCVSDVNRISMDGYESTYPHYFVGYMSM
jgi:hypothetical protein